MIFSDDGRATLSKVVAMGIVDAEMFRILTQATLGAEDISSRQSTCICGLMIGLLTDGIHEMEVDEAPGDGELKSALVEHYWALNPPPEDMTPDEARASFLAGIDRLIAEREPDPPYIGGTGKSSVH
jgi:hypothetical protein